MDYTATLTAVERLLGEKGWTIARFGVETIPEKIRDILESVYDITGLYIRTRPDLIAKKFGIETWMIECKDWTKKVSETGNYSVEALPWFFHRHLLKMGVNNCYAIKDPTNGLRFFRPDLPPFSGLHDVQVPMVHKKLFNERVAVRLRQAFNFHVKFRYSESGGSGDPFILIPDRWIASGTEVGYFSEFGRIRVG